MRIRTDCLLAAALCAACAGDPNRQTLARLHDVEPDVSEVQVEHGLDQAVAGYRKFLEEAPESSLTPEAMRRLADLQIEKEYGLLGDGQGIREMAAPKPSAVPKPADTAARRAPAAKAARSESEAEFERRATADTASRPSQPAPALELPGENAAPPGPLEAIALYDQILAKYPNYPHNDEVLYQKSRAFDELGRTEDAIAVMEQMIALYPQSRHQDEVQFRRAEYFFMHKKYRDAEKAYSAITAMGPGSEYYELALYKLGWTFYKQDLHEEALHEYVALLDYKVSTGYDFDAPHDEDTERRIADTYRVISLCFSNLGGSESIEQYFSANGHRSFEDRIYSHLGEFYLEKLRYQDAASAYKAFVDLNPLHHSAPHFSMRVIEIYEQGGFPKLVLESKKQFAASYGLDSEYWRHFDVAASPEVLRYLKTNLQDLASHYHARFQDPDAGDDRQASFQEAARWYRAYLASFPKEEESASIDYRLADLLLEHKDFAEAAREYERTAYDYPPHERAAAAGYAAIYAHRERQKQASGAEQESARRDAVASTLRFVDAFPQHEHAAAVLGTAVDDLYELKDYAPAIATGQKLIQSYPQADPAIRRTAWAVVAHASFETQSYAQAEQAYTQVLELTPEGDASRQSLGDNLAASIYKQGEQANAAADPRAAAGHFLRIAEVAPTSSIRPTAEYDAGVALMKVEDWAKAAEVLEAFRQHYPEHELRAEATRQIAFALRSQGDLSRAGAEYERVATEAGDGELQREALLEAGDLYVKSDQQDRALAAWRSYVTRFPEPIEMAVETRWKIAERLAAVHDDAAYREELGRIVATDRTAGRQRTDRVRYLAARSALALSERLYREFDEIALVQPFEQSLKRKKQRMDAALAAFGDLVDYEVGEVTAAATFYMAELYASFSQALMKSERPANLTGPALQEYEDALEEEAFPFEEKAIQVHQKNLELMAGGIYNPWIEKSLAALARLMPGRYAKAEASSGYLESLDGYAYTPPRASALMQADTAPAAGARSATPAPAEENAESAPPPPADAAEDAHAN
ncbi:MAG TPA: tetratricopeptide repeat protein [Myxococcota bacterium]|nr:tetratricopeptide repeat protein [Myxococcota bacterium]